MQEIWKDIKDYEGMYQVSNLGNVKSIDRYVDFRGGKKFYKGKIMSLKKVKRNNGFYLSFGAWKDGNSKMLPVHRVVALAFIDNEENKQTVHHINHHPEDNRVSNLSWATISEQRDDHWKAIFSKRVSKANKGAGNGRYKGDVLAIKDGEVKFVLKGTADMEKHGFKSSNVSLCVNGKKKKYKGYEFKRVQAVKDIGLV